MAGPGRLSLLQICGSYKSLRIYSKNKDQEEEVTLCPQREKARRTGPGIRVAQESKGSAHPRVSTHLPEHHPTGAPRPLPAEGDMCAYAGLSGPQSPDGLASLSAQP